MWKNRLKLTLKLLIFFNVENIDFLNLTAQIFYHVETFLSHDVMVWLGISSFQASRISWCSFQF